MVCCTTQEQFRREPRAITRNGQIKGGERHEKDDRHRLDDRSRYVLGWSNTAKLAALQAKASVLEALLGRRGQPNCRAVQDQQQGACKSGAMPWPSWWSFKRLQRARLAGPANATEEARACKTRLVAVGRSV
ncbi:MAG: hypothetical protein U5M53_12705 [Rhodoferax sp.]|nr:hypothetical protein [Rhodoferax sp.]